MLCDKKFGDLRALCVHLSKSHEIITLEDKTGYYKQYINTESNELCSHCGLICDFQNMSLGFKEFCKLCLSKSRSSNQVLYWILKHDYSEEEATEAARKSQSERGKKAPRGNEKRKMLPICKEYWMDKGFCEEEAVIQVSKEQTRRINKCPEYKRKEKARVSSKRCIEYWINGGCSNDEAELRVSEYQRDNASKIKDTKLLGMTLKNCVRRHGETEGRKRYKEWRVNLKKRKTIRKQNYSKKSLTLFFFLSRCGFNGLFGRKEKHLYKEKSESTYFYDFVYRDKIIEFNGNYYHVNPETHSDDTVVFGKTASEIREKDSKKILYAESCGYTVMVIWEKDFDDNPRDILDKCIEFLEK